MKAGWQTKTLGDVCEFQRGLTYAKGDEVDVSDNIVLRAMNIDLATNLLDFSELKYISDEIAIPENKKVKAGSLMICTASGSKSHLGKVAYIDGDYGYAFGGFMGMVTPKHELHPKFLFHLMTSPDYKDFIAALSDGANINNLKFDDLRQFVVPVPPLPEQQRIVGILDEAFDGIATAKTNAEQNLQNARALFESHLQSVFTQRGEGWVVKRLDDACDLITCGVAAKPKYVDVGVPFLSAKNVKRGEIVWNGYNCVSKKTHDELTKNNKPLRGDILYTRVGSYGEAAVIEEDIEFSVFVSLTLIKPIKKLLNNYYLKYYLNSSEVKELAKQSISSSGVGNLNVGTVREFPIHLPSLTEQATIVAKLDEISKETQRLESLYQRKLAALAELKKSLLHQAFSGAL